MSGISRLKPGARRTQIEILRPDEVQNAQGGYETVWTVVSRPYAEALGQDGREAVIGKALAGISSYRIRIPYRRDLVGKDEYQVRLDGPGGTDLNITSITDPLGTREQLMIIASTESAIETPAS